MRVIRKADEKGALEIAFCRYGDTDKDGDVFEVGSLYSTGNVLMSQFNHSLDVPVGVGVLGQSGMDRTWAGQMHMASQVALDHLAHIIAMDEDQEYSFRALLEEWKFGENYGLIIVRARVIEVSPVMVGAGNHTGTLAVKSGIELHKALGSAGSGSANANSGANSAPLAQAGSEAMPAKAHEPPVADTSKDNNRTKAYLAAMEVE